MNDDNKLQKYEKPSAVSLRDVTPAFGACSTGAGDTGGGNCSVGNGAMAFYANACTVGNSAQSYGAGLSGCSVGNTPTNLGG